MSLELYLTFVAAVTVFAVLPGPAVSLIVANSISHGTRAALACVAGGIAALAVHVTVAVLGMHAVLAVLGAWFEWLRWAGVAYLLWLGVRTWRMAPVSDRSVRPRPGRVLYWQGFGVNLTNPKPLAFYAAFFPQFVDPAAPALPQLALIGGTFLAVVALFDSAYAALGGRLRGFVSDARRLRLRNRLTGALLVGTGIGLALMRRP